MRNKIRKTMFSLLFGVLFTGVLAFGQITGDLQINVSDQSNAAIPNATVTVRNVDTGTTRNTATDATGQIRVSQLDPGRYEVKVAAPGFTTVTQTAQIESGGNSTLAFTLMVSSTSEQIVVESVATPINTVNPQLQGTIENAAIRDLPLVSTGVLGLAQHTSGNRSGDTEQSRSWGSAATTPTAVADAETTLRWTAPPLPMSAPQARLDLARCLQTPSRIQSDHESVQRGIWPQREFTTADFNQPGQQSVPRRDVRVPAQQLLQRSRLFRSNWLCDAQYQ